MVYTDIVPEKLITTYLEMTNPNQFKPSYLQSAYDVRVEPMQTPDVTFYRFLYKSVGEKWRWRDRLSMSSSDLRALLSQSTTRVLVLYVNGAPAGYIELEKQAGGAVEVAYFGLREEYHGRGLGKHLLSYGIDEAWKMGASRIWLHTCNLDGEHALTNYQKRGFRVYMRREEPMPTTYM